MRTTIKDIANKTNLSTTTVSLVLNGKGDKISGATRELVINTARELHYRPNQLAIGLVKRHTCTLGLVLPNITSWFFSHLVRAIEDEAAKQDYQIILCHSADRCERDISSVNMLMDKGVDGIIFLAAIESTAQHIKGVCQIAEQAGVPIVLIDRTTDVSGVSTVTLDNHLGGYMAVRHLLDEGHRRIGVITGPVNAILTQARMGGVKKALREEGILPESSRCFEGNYQSDSGVLAADYFAGTDVTAVFSFNDMMALSFIRRATDLGFQIPRDLSVVGFDDISYARFLTVPLTTVRQPVQEMGVSAAQMVIDGAQRTMTDCVHRVFMPSLVVRNSTACYGAASAPRI